jgi:hypothetical protein
MSSTLPNHGMESRDWITLAALIVTIISSHWLASKQTRKTKRVKWIEDFRSEIANLISLSNQVENHNISTLIPFSKCGYVILMLLDENKKNQKPLMLEIQSFGLFMTETFTPNLMQEYKQRVEKITNLAKGIIRQEENRL